MIWYRIEVITTDGSTYDQTEIMIRGNNIYEVFEELSQLTPEDEVVEVLIKKFDQ